MSRRKGRSVRSDRYAKLPRQMLQSEAFKALGYYERSVLTALAAEYHGGNNGNVALTYSQARDWYGLRSASRFYKAITTLEEAGFIRKTHTGGFNLGKRSPARYELLWQRLDIEPEGGIPTPRSRPKKEIWAVPTKSGVLPAGGIHSRPPVDT